MKLAVAAFLALFALHGSPVHAQRATELDTGSNIPVPKRARIPDKGTDAERGSAVMREFARCTIDRKSAQVTSVLSMPLDTEYQKSLRRLVTDECLAEGMISFKSIMLRGALFIELWQRRKSLETRGKPWSPDLPAYDLNAPLGELDAEARNQQWLLGFANCVVTRNRSAASDVVVNAVGSKAQNEAYARLIPDLNPCLPKGQQLTFSKPVLEGVLAEALYRAPAPANTQAGMQ